MNAVILWALAAIVLIVGVVQLVQGQTMVGVVLVVLGCLAGPGGDTLFRSDRQS